MENNYRSAEIFYNDIRAGILTKTSSGFEFRYYSDYLESDSPRPISLSMPLSNEVYRSKELFAFFEGLLPEGWLMSQTSSVLKIDPSDKFNILLHVGKDTVGAITIIPITGA
jgi:serine/threonine-protein kinase HipA